jgi:hypothetical protein
MYQPVSNQSGLQSGLNIMIVAGRSSGNSEYGPPPTRMLQLTLAGDGMRLRQGHAAVTVMGVNAATVVVSQSGSPTVTRANESSRERQLSTTTDQRPTNLFGVRGANAGQGYRFTIPRQFIAASWLNCPLMHGPESRLPANVLYLRLLIESVGEHTALEMMVELLFAPPTQESQSLTLPHTVYALIVDSSVRHTAHRVAISYKEEGLLGNLASQKPSDADVITINKKISEHIEALTKDGIHIDGKTLSLPMKRCELSLDEFDPNANVEWCALSQGNDTFHLVTALMAIGLVESGNKHPITREPLASSDFIRGQAFLKLLEKA